MMLNNQPIIAYDNLLQGNVYTMLAGIDEPSSPLSNAWLWDMSRPALPVADANGILSFSVDTPTGVGFGKNALGFTPFGQGGFGGLKVADTFILGASRNLPAGYRFTSGHLQVLADGVEVLSQTIYNPINTSVIYQLADHSAASKYTITISMLTPNATAVLPEIFIGKSLTMPYVEYGFDEYGEVFAGSNFKAESGREYRSVRYRRLEQKPRWKHIEQSKAINIRAFIESALESAQPFWFAWAPASHSNAVYMMRHKGDTVKMPLSVGMRFDFALDLIEAI